MFWQAGEEGGAVAGEAGMEDELVFVDEIELREREGKLDAAGEEAVAGLLFELLDGGSEVAAQEASVPIDAVEGGGDDVLLGGVDGAGEGFHPFGS